MELQTGMLTEVLKHLLILFGVSIWYQMPFTKNGWRMDVKTTLEKFFLLICQGLVYLSKRNIKRWLKALIYMICIERVMMLLKHSNKHMEKQSLMDKK
jgi:virulence-associated protein VapD